jgi:polar amino acid transport system substrate-binding protein
MRWFHGIWLGALAAVLGLLVAGARAQPLTFVTEDTSYTYLRSGRVAGPATDVVEAVLKRARIEDYRIQLYPWARAYDLALKEPNVLIYLIARTPARESLFKWVGEFMKIEYHFYKLRDNHDVVVRTLDDARRYTIGTMRDDLRHHYLQDKGFRRLVVSAQNIDNFRKLVHRQVQLIPLPENDATLLCRETGFDCAGLEKVLTLDELTASLYLAASLATPDTVVEPLRKAFQELKAQGTVAKLMAVGVR